MSESAQPAALEPDRTTFEATVTDVREVEGTTAVELSESYFYAASGGQPADRGEIAGLPVAGVELADGEHVHFLADGEGDRRTDGPAADGGPAAAGADAAEGPGTVESPADLSVGDAVACSVDEEFRTYCRRAHTASHVLYGAGRRLLDDLGYGGFGISEEKVRVDFTTTTDVDDDTLVELERLANRTVWESRPVSWETVPTGEAYDREEVSFNTKTEEGVMADADAVRVVTVEGWDWAACGGTHVRNTREIGPVSVLERSNPGEGLTRVEFAVGPRAIAARADQYRSLLSASRTAGVAPADLPGEVRRLRSELDDLEEEAADLRRQALAGRIADFDRVDREGEGYTLAAGVLKDVGPNDVEDALRGAAGDVADAVVAVGRSGSTFVAVAADGPADAGAVVEEVTEEFGGGGGGSPQFAQGGGIGAAPREVTDHLTGR